MKKTLSKPMIAYLLSMSIILIASTYPLYMGIKVLSAFIREGQIDVSEYPKYIIPYTPVCGAIIIAAALIPLAPIDFLVIILSGTITYLILFLIRQREKLSVEEGY